MKKRYLILIIMVFFMMMDVRATTGSIKQNSVINCNGTNYGYHGNPKHWHTVKKVDDKWVITSSEEVSEPSCYGDIANEKVTVTLSKCVDGDTAKFLTSDGNIKTTRFLAIDTPESVHPTKEVEEYGKEASEYTCKLLTEAKEIVLEFDKNSDKEDKYGRLLAFVYVDDKMVQEELIKVGYAKVAYLYADYTYTSQLQELESVAKSKKIGIWNSEIIETMEEEEAESSETSTTSLATSEENDSFIDGIIDFIKKICNKIFKLFKNML